MNLYRYSMKELKEYGKKGYKIIPCESNEQAIRVRDKLRLQKKCAIAGIIRNSENKDIPFVITKDKVKRGA